jgi:hypothetical protein
LALAVSVAVAADTALVVAALVTVLAAEVVAVFNPVAVPSDTVVDESGAEFVGDGL